MDKKKLRELIKKLVAEYMGTGASGGNSTDGNEIPNNATLTADTSPAGDILFSTRNFNNGDSYTIMVEVR